MPARCHHITGSSCLLIGSYRLIIGSREMMNGRVQIACLKKIICAHLNPAVLLKHWSSCNYPHIWGYRCNDFILNFELTINPGIVTT